MYWIGHIAGLFSILAVFVSLSIAYWLRSANTVHWQPVHLPQQLTLSTIFLLAASLSIEMSRYALKHFGIQTYAVWLTRTSVFAAAFIVTQGLCWYKMLAQTMVTNSNEQFFYVLTGAHAVHVMGGMVFLGFLMWRTRHAWKEFDEVRRRTITTIVASYWHFMSAIWLGLYALLALKSSG
jgi:cytochrome c oxidase subunit III